VTDREPKAMPNLVATADPLRLIQILSSADLAPCLWRVDDATATTIMDAVELLALKSNDDTVPNLAIVTSVITSDGQAEYHLIGCKDREVARAEAVKAIRRCEGIAAIADMRAGQVLYLDPSNATLF